jgi:hypothetical protein
VELWSPSVFGVRDRETLGVGRSNTHRNNQKRHWIKLDKGRSQKKTGPLRARFSTPAWGRQRHLPEGNSCCISVAYLGGWRRPTRNSTIQSMRFPIPSHNARGNMSAMRSSQSAADSSLWMKQFAEDHSLGELSQKGMRPHDFCRAVSASAGIFICMSCASAAGQINGRTPMGRGLTRDPEDWN